MQNSKLAIALASAGALGMAVSHSASAAIATTESGNSNLIFVAVDNTTGESYFDNLGTTAIPGVPAASTTFSDAAYTQFLSDVGSDSISYAVVGGSAITPTNGVTANLIDTTVGGTTTPTSPSNSLLKQAPLLLDQNVINPLNGLNGTSQNSGNGYVVSSNTAVTTPQYTAASALQTFNGKTPFATVSAAGTSQSFYTFTTSAGSLLSASTQALDGTFNYTGNTLTYTAAGGGGGTTPPPAVPLPPAVWLLGSGLLGLMGISRRRAA